MIRLEDVHPGNWRLGLKVASSQQNYAADAAGLLARAYAYRAFRSRAFVIYQDESPVGMGLYYDLPEWKCYDFSQLFIDERYQGRGYGRAAVALALDAMRRGGAYSRVVLCYVEENAARRLYESFGFVECGRDGDEIEMELRLR